MNTRVQQPTENFDAVIVGAGLDGMWLAYHLSQEGKKVCVVDKKDFTKPAFWQQDGNTEKGQLQESAGMGSWQRFSCNVGREMHPNLPEMTMESLKLYQTLSDEAVANGFEPFYIPKPSLVVANADEENNIVQQYKENCDRLRNDGIEIDYEILDEEQLTRYGLTPDAAEGMIGFLESDKTAGTINIDPCLKYLKHKVEQAGKENRVILGKELKKRDITQINNGEDGYAVKTGQCIAVGRKLVYAAGAKGISDAIQGGDRRLPYFLDPNTLNTVFKVQRVPVTISKNVEHTKLHNEETLYPGKFLANIGFATKKGRGLIDVLFPMDNEDGTQNIFIARYTGLENLEGINRQVYLGQKQTTPVDWFGLLLRLDTVEDFFNFNSKKQDISPSQKYIRRYRYFHHHFDRSWLSLVGGQALYFLSLTSSGLPLCDVSQKHNNVFNFFGCHGSWAKTAPGFAKHMAELVCEKKELTYDREPFSLESMLAKTVGRQETLPGAWLEQEATKFPEPHIFDLDRLAFCYAMIDELFPNAAERIKPTIFDMMRENTHINAYMGHCIHGAHSQETHENYLKYMKNITSGIIPWRHRPLGERVPVSHPDSLFGKAHAGGWYRYGAGLDALKAQTQDLVTWMTEGFEDYEKAALNPENRDSVSKKSWEDKIWPASANFQEVMTTSMRSLALGDQNRFSMRDVALNDAVGGELFRAFTSALERALSVKLEAQGTQAGKKKNDRHY